MVALQRQAGNAAVAALLREPDAAPAPLVPPGGAAPGPPGAPGGVLVDDEAPTGPGQLHRSEFVAQLRTRAGAVIEAGIDGPLRRAAAQAFLGRWLAERGGGSAAALEAAIRSYAPDAAAAGSAEGCLTVIEGRLRAEVARWIAGENAAGDGGSAILPKGGGGGAAGRDDPELVRSSLGPGRPLDGAVAGRMGGALGRDLSGVRLHDDSSGGALASRLGARAVAVGEHVAFAPGEYRPGSPVGDALIAHELAHVVQQADGRADEAQAKDGAAEGALEADADAAAVGVVMGLWTGLRGRAAELGRLAGPRLRTGLRLSSCGRRAATPVPDAGPGPATPATPPAPAVPTAVGPDQHAGTAPPDAATQQFILSELNPGVFSAAPTGAAPVRLTWDGAAGQPNAAAQQGKLTADLIKAMAAHLKAAMPPIKAQSKRPHLALASYEGPGRAAKTVVDRVFADQKAAAALTSAGRHGVTFTASGPGRNLFDANDVADRAAAGAPIDAADVSSWIAQHDPKAAAVVHSHHFDPDGSADERTFFRDKIITPFVGAHKADLELYDRFGFALAPQGTGTGRTVATPTTLQAGLSTTAGTGGTPSPAERATRWAAWKFLAHEYIHTLAHPAFDGATSAGGSVMNEGFCEMFTAEVLNPIVATAGADAALRAEVEGTAATPEPTADILAKSYASPPTYVSDRKHAEAIRGRAGIGSNGVRAAYFQGHLELLGLTPGGGIAAPGGPADTLDVPAGVTTLAQLATATGLSEGEIKTANSAVNFAAALPGRLSLPGCRAHRVVAVTEIGVGSVPETRAQVASQNGVSEADLVRANPGVPDWTKLVDGQILLIPKH